MVMPLPLDPPGNRWRMPARQTAFWQSFFFELLRTMIRTPKLLRNLGGKTGLEQKTPVDLKLLPSWLKMTRPGVMIIKR